MGSEEFTRGVRGSSGEALRMTEVSALEVDNYVDGGGFKFDGSDYPYTVDPSDATIQILHLTQAGEISMTVTTETGNTLTYDLSGGVGVIDWWSIESVEFTDPNGTGATLSGAWGGGSL